jgi:hypothetical protein
MKLTIANLKQVVFPVYVLPHGGWEYKDGLLFIDGLIVDDTKMPSDRLGIRRIQCGRSKDELFRLRKCVYDVEEFVRGKTVKHLIDSRGVVYEYEKTISIPLICHQVLRVERKEVASLVWLKGVNHPFTIKRPPIVDVAWARVLYLNNVPWLLYDYVAEQAAKKSYRRV